MIIIIIAFIECSNYNFITKLECGQDRAANVMAALPNIGGTRCPTPQSLADAHY